MYYINLANKGYYDTSGSFQPDYDPTPNTIFIDGNGNTVSFQNLQPDDIYWSSTAYSGGVFNFQDCAIFFLFGDDSGNAPPGYQNQAYKDDYHYAWAVRDGDVAAVPEPFTLLLLGSGLLGLWGFRKKFKK